MKAKRKGFTLVEILIVVVILGILAAIVIPQFTDASQEAKTSACQSNLATMRSQLELWKIRESPLGGTYPTDAQGLAQLVTDRYMVKVPTEPFGGSWTYTAATGKVISSTDPNW